MEDITKDKAPEFLKTIWKHIDLNGDGKLTRIELKMLSKTVFSSNGYLSSYATIKANGVLILAHSNQK